MGYDMNWREVPDWARSIAEENQAKFAALAAERDALFPEGITPFRKYNEEDQAISDARRKIVESDEYKAKQKAVEEAWPDDPSYFRLNIWGMSTMRDIMDALGIGYWAPSPDFPSSDGIDWDDESSPEYLAWEEEANKARAQSPRPTVTNALGLASSEVWEQPTFSRISGEKELFGLPLHKFTSNDGWIVTPDDIREALKIYRSLKPADILSVVKHYTDQFSDGAKPEDVVEWLDRWMVWNEQAMLHGNGYEVW